MTFARFLGATLTGALLALSAPAAAHTDGKAQHGGIFVSASDLEFELVAGADGATLYLYDHGKPLASSGASAKLTVLDGAQKTEADLRPAGDNRLEAKGVKMAKGAKAVASVTLPGRKPVSVRFASR